VRLAALLAEREAGETPQARGDVSFLSIVASGAPHARAKFSGMIFLNLFFPLVEYLCRDPINLASLPDPNGPFGCSFQFVLLPGQGRGKKGALESSSYNFEVMEDADLGESNHRRCCGVLFHLVTYVWFLGGFGVPLNSCRLCCFWFDVSIRLAK